jgi:predicted metalloprotease with PDZ domain
MPDGAVEFKTETLRDFVDCPLICGEHFRTVELKPKNSPTAFLHLASEASSALQLDEKVVEKYRNVASEAGVLFGGEHFSAYHFLVTLSDDLGYTGLEHRSSSL